jgi:hypothetical protein
MAVDRYKVLSGEKNGVELEFNTEVDLTAANTFFDNAGNGFTADNVQDAIEEIGESASPGFSFGRTSASTGTWLNRVGEIPTNRTGVTIGISNPLVFKIFISCENIETFTVGIYVHDGDSINLTLLGSVAVTAARSGSFLVNYPTTQGKQLAARVITASGSVQNLGVDVILKGNN